MNEEKDMVIPVKQETEIIAYGEAIQIPKAFRSEQEAQDFLDALERRDRVEKEIFRRSLEVLLPTDFHDFNGKPYLQGCGAERLMKYFGISMVNKKRIPAIGYDTIDNLDNSFRLRVTYTADFIFMDRCIPAEGMRDTHNRFYCKTQEGFKEIADIELPDLDRASISSLKHDGISTMLGLKGVPWSYLEQFGFTPEKTTSHTYGTGTKGGDAAGSDQKTKELKVKIGDMLLEIADGDKDVAAQMLENYTRWTDKEDIEHKGKRELSKLTPKQTPVIYSKVKKDYEEQFGGQPPEEKEVSENKSQPKLGL